SDVEPIDPSLVSLLISEIDIALYTQVAILTILVYDTVTTMDKEVNAAWHYHLHFLLINYSNALQNRYIGILGAISGIVCKSIIYWVEDRMTVLLIDYILLMRVLALHHQDKRLVACMRTLFGLDAVFILGIFMYDNIYEEIAVGELAKGVTICGVNRSPPKVWGALSWAVPMVYAIILMVLALYKAAEHWRETAGFSQLTLVKVVIEDQAIYFIMVIFCSVMKIISIQLYIPNVLLADILSVLSSPSLLCVLGSHLLVHLKEAGERGANGGTSYRMKTVSNIAFS
ncbi:hypothetical protein DFH11DRAFT_1830608, partial [Phellopilus nigrolimitatus]